MLKDGGAGSDRIDGSSGDDTLRDTIGGNDDLRGLGGDDNLYVQRSGTVHSSNVSLDGGDGFDDILFDGQQRFLDSVTISGGADLDRIAVLEAAHTVVDAGAGDDFVSIDDGAASTVVTLGSGVDTLKIEHVGMSGARGPVVITDFATGTNGDRLDILDIIQKDLHSWDQSANPFKTGDLRLVQHGASTLLEGNVAESGEAPAFKTLIEFQHTNASHFTAENLGSYPPDGSAPAGATFTGGNGQDAFAGTIGADVMTGGANDDRLYGRGGDDRIDGGTGNDYLGGDAGHDQLHGGSGNDTLIVGDGGDDRLYGDDGDDTLIGGGKDFARMYGGTGADHLSGSFAADILDGGTGADTMAGSDGNDTYLVDDRHDSVSEAAGQGIDTVQASIAYTLTANVENLQLTGTATTGIGNALANAITGTAAADTLSGKDGDDVLDGKAGADTMNGGQGNDIFHVDSTHDVVVEGYHQGADLIVSSVSWALGDNLESLTLSGSARINGSGNALANHLSGNGGDNALYGLDGDDSLSGSGGIDKLFGGNGTDDLHGGAGNDVLTGSAGDDRLVGDSGDDVLTAGSGNDVVQGGLGTDVATGGSGRDLFVFDDRDFTAPVETKCDRITDFNGAGGDRVDLSLVDARPGGKDDAFSFIGTHAFDGHAGELRVYEKGVDTFVAGDTNGDKVADFLLSLAGHVSLTAADIVL